MSNPYPKSFDPTSHLNSPPRLSLSKKYLINKMSAPRGDSLEKRASLRKSYALATLNG